LEEIAKICLIKPLRQARLLQRINHLKMDDRLDRVSLEKEKGKSPSEPGFPRSQQSRPIVLNTTLNNPSSSRMTLGRDISSGLDQNSMLASVKPVKTLQLYRLTPRFELPGQF